MDNVSDQSLNTIFCGQNVSLLKELCSANNIIGYSSMNKSDLIKELIKYYDIQIMMLNAKNIEEIKKECREKNVKNFSSMKKSQMIDKLILLQITMANSKIVINIEQNVILTKKVKDSDSIEQPIVSDISTESVKVPKITKKVPKKVTEVVETPVIISEETVVTKKITKKVVNENNITEDTSVIEVPVMKKISKKVTKKVSKVNSNSEVTNEVPTEVTEIDSIEPIKKKAIPKAVKTDIWNTYISPNINEHRCLCCKKTLIKITSFHAGHIISEANGGTMEISNLRPICSTCNHSMGTTNMDKYIIKYGYYY